MNAPRPLVVLIAVLGAGALAGCGPQRIETVRPGQAQVVLLPDPDDGSVGVVVVSNSAGAVNLAAARESTTASPGQAPTAVTVLSQNDVNRLFGGALSALPPAPAHFVLYFQFETDQLTEESRAVVPRVLEAVRNRPSPDVGVIGHTDTSGSADTNNQLGLRRAGTIRDLLVAAGVSADVIDVSSHGEADPLVKTADGVLEPRNRRVEITVQ